MNDIIGYAPSKLYIVIPSIINITLNVLYLIMDTIKIIKKKINNRVTSLDKYLFPLSIVELFISTFWLVNSYLPSNKTNHTCEVIGSFQTFFYIFELILIYTIISHLKHLILNPLKYIMKSKKKIIVSLLINTIISILITLILYFSNNIGESPMNSCLIKYVVFFQTNYMYKIILVIFLLSPIFLIAFIIYKVVIVVKSESYNNDVINQKLFRAHIFYLFGYLLFYFLFPILYFTWAFKVNNLESFSFAISLILNFGPIIIWFVRIYISKLSVIYSNNFIPEDGDAMSLLDKIKDVDGEQNQQFESSAIKKFVSNFYISVCFCLEKSNSFPNIKYSELKGKMIDKSNNYVITQKKIAKELPNSQLVNDTLIKSREKFSIQCVEYSPYVFNYLRQLDQVSNEMIISSMLPMNNKNGIKETEGKGGAFFINSDDYEFILKTITEQEYKIMMRLLHNDMVEYFKLNGNSIICRIYGVYKIKIDTGLLQSDEIYFILMKNVVGSFIENLLCKYDLKGSSLNRKVGYENIDKTVMKDLNFNEVEEVFLLNKADSKKLLNICEKDSTFLCSSGIMDYSLFVAKISLNNDEIKSLFGRDHRKATEKQFLEMIGKVRESRPTNSSIEKEPDDNNENEKDKLIDNGEDNIRFKEGNIGCLKKYLYPSLKGDVAYIMSIIDYFQIYNLQKNLETKYKKLKAGVQEKAISSVPPDEYKDRFIEFVKNKTDSEHYLQKIYDPNNKNDF